MGDDRLSRRRFLGGIAALGLAACSGGGERSSSRPSGAPTTSRVPVPRLADHPFTLGAASGDPLPDGVVLWTRLALDPSSEEPMPAVDVPVVWEVAHDERFARVVASGTEVTGPDLGHSIHADVRGLEPDRGYFFRFRVGDHVSAVGRTRTLPAPGARVETLRIAATCCQAYKSGYYTVYEQLAGDDVACVLFLGDYIYELEPGNVRDHGLAPAQTLDEFRRFYAVHRADDKLQAAHLASPWIVIWDDHEVEDNYAALDPGGIGTMIDPDAAEKFAAKRAAAYRAWWENMPVRVPPPDGSGAMRIYRSFDFGALARVSVVDNRQYRTPIPTGEGEGNLPRPFGGGPQLPAAFDPDASFLGPEQERWLLGRIDTSAATWQVLAQQTLMAECDRAPDDPAKGYSMDAWDGYVSARNRLLGHVRDAGVANFVSIGGDIHTSAVTDLIADYKVDGSPVVGTEFIAPSASSVELLLPEYVEGARRNPHVKLYDTERRGYLRCTFAADRLVAEYRYVSTTAQPEASPVAGTTWEVEAGKPGARQV